MYTVDQEFFVKNFIDDFSQQKLNAKYYVCIT
jgi:hypothetical protein